MPEGLDELIELSMLREEVKQLKGYIVRLERENAYLQDRLSHRRPSTAAKSQAKRARGHWGERLQALSLNR